MSGGQGARGVVDQRIAGYFSWEEFLPYAIIDEDLQRRPARLDPEVQRIERRAVARRFQRALAREQEPNDFLRHIRPRASDVFAQYDHMVDGHAAVGKGPVARGGLGVGNEMAQPRSGSLSPTTAAS